MGIRKQWNMHEGAGTWDPAQNDEVLTLDLPGRPNSIRVSTVCPHFGGPLNFDTETGTLYCPWHGWRFEPITGKCLNRKTNVRMRTYEQSKKDETEGNEN